MLDVGVRNRNARNKPAVITNKNQFATDAFALYRMLTASCFVTDYARHNKQSKA